MSTHTVRTPVTGELYNKLSGIAKKNRKTVSDFVLELVEDGLGLFEDVTDMADDQVQRVMKRYSTKREEVKAPVKAAKKNSAQRKK